MRNELHVFVVSLVALGAMACFATEGPDGGAPDARTESRRDAGPTSLGQPAGWTSELALREAEDRDPDPRVFEVDIEAKITDLEILPGVKTPAWTYNGTVPGPLIRLQVGDRLVVHFKNSLPEQTTIHWHGVRLPVEQDGVPGHSQLGVRPGGTFKYDFVVPDAGLYWFHPHFNSAAQQGDGLYGAILVEDPKEPAGFGGAADSVVLQLSDMSIDPMTGALGAHDAGGDVATLFGREGEVLLVNGRKLPTLKARSGMRQRWRVVNSAKSRYFQLALDGHTFLRIGGDGGLLPRPIEVERPILTPGERADFLIVPTGEPGTEAILRWTPNERGYGSTFLRHPVDLMKVAFTDDPPVPASQLPPVPSTGVTVAPLDLTNATPVSISFTRNDLLGADGKTVKEFRLGVNGKRMEDGDAFTAKIGETQIWTIENTMQFSHPFHLHGFFFQVLDADGKPIPEWKDTTDLPTVTVDGKSGKVTNTKIRLAVRFDDRPGMWMFHCHILDHVDAGMGAMLDVRP